jgi:hypothetical protein
MSNRKHILLEKHTDHTGDELYLFDLLSEIASDSEYSVKLPESVQETLFWQHQYYIH